MTDPMTRLRAADPARRADLGAVDQAAFAALREEITMTTTIDPAVPTTAVPGGPAPRRRRLGRRGAVALGLAAVLTGSGVAYAAVQAFRGSSGEGVTCVTAWDADAAEGLGVEAAGPWLTGDPYADCATLLAEQGLPPLDDPVAFEHDGQTVVAPAAEVPDGAERLEGAVAVDAAALELERSSQDLVDGGRSACRPLAEGVAWARGEVDRLGLEGWTVTEHEPVQDALPCANVEVRTGERAVVVVPTAEDPVDVYLPDEIAPVVATLRSEVADGCVSLDAARAVVDAALSGVADPFPTTSVPDESAACARVDLVVGGSVQATVHGPSDAG